MEGSIECFDTLICSGARRLTGYQRRLFMAEVTTELCKGRAVKSNDVRVGTRNGPEGTARVVKGFAAWRIRRTRPLAQRREGPATGCGNPCDSRASYLRRSATEVVATVQNLSAAEVRRPLIATGHPSEKLPSERTRRDISTA